MSIYKKLAEIQKSIKGLGQDKRAQGYTYVTGNKVLDHVKPLMIEHGLLLKQEILSIENERQDYFTGLVDVDKTQNWKGKPKSEILSKVMMRFTWVDVDTGEKDENLFGANGQNDWEKGLGSALSYAERYFILKYFHIATDEDDIDNPDRKKDDSLKKGEENQSFQHKKEDKPFNRNLAIKAIMELIGGDAAKLNKQLDYYKIKTLDAANEVQLKAIYKYLSPKK
ncbi:MAG: ERF family protein [Fusobacteriaceae bacterium]